MEKSMLLSSKRFGFTTMIPLSLSQLHFKEKNVEHEIHHRSRRRDYELTCNFF
jgi:hypothetical protein